jgi:hypothetical protein
MSPNQRSLGSGDDRCPRKLLLNRRRQFFNLLLKPSNPSEVPVLFATHFNQEVFNPGQTLRDWLHDSDHNMRNFRAKGLRLCGHSVDSSPDCPNRCWSILSEIYPAAEKNATRRARPRGGPRRYVGGCRRKPRGSSMSSAGFQPGGVWLFTHASTAASILANASAGVSPYSSGNWGRWESENPTPPALYLRLWQNSDRYRRLQRQPRCHTNIRPFGVGNLCPSCHYVYGARSSKRLCNCPHRLTFQRPYRFTEFWRCPLLNRRSPRGPLHCCGMAFTAGCKSKQSRVAKLRLEIERRLSDVRRLTILATNSRARVRQLRKELAEVR